MRTILCFAVLLIATGISLGVNPAVPRPNVPKQEIPKVSPVVPSIIITPWVRDGNLKRWEAFVADGTHTTPIVVSEDADGHVSFFMERKCFEKDKKVPRTILAWRGGRETGLELRCNGEEVVSRMPRRVEDAAMGAAGFPSELREKIRKERALLDTEPSEKEPTRPAPQQKRKPTVPPADIHPPREFDPFEHYRGYRRV